jgi:F-type H+-transporting ATPase subunit gamma
MASLREMRLRIRSVKNIAQVTRALETVSASHERRAQQAVNHTTPYTERAWKVLIHLADQPGHASLHPLLTERENVKNVLVVYVSGDRGLAGAYNLNILRETLQYFRNFEQPVSYVTVGRKGRDLLLRRRKTIIGEFSHLPSPPTFADVSAIGRLVVDEFLSEKVDQVYLAYTLFENMIWQRPIIRKLLPLDVRYAEPGQELQDFNVTHHHSNAVFLYEPDQAEILDQIVPRFTQLQIFQAILSSQASEHAARMVAMRNATENANDLIYSLQLQFNKIRQQSITSEMLDITGGAEALQAK